MTSPFTIPTATGEKRLALGILCLVLVANGAALSAELTAGGVTGNDNVYHIALVKGIVGAVEHHQNPLDFWSGEGAFGAPLIRTYQPLAHMLVALVYFGLGKTVPLVTVFAWVSYLAMAMLPAGFFAAARLMELPPHTAAAGAMLAPLVSTDAWYGLDYSSYVTAGRGLFPQSVAAILLLLAVGCGFRTLRHGTHGVLTGLLLGLTCICHFIYGWIGAVTLCLLAVLPDATAGRATRIRRVAGAGCVALAVSAFQLLPVWLDGPFLNHSHWEPAWKFDSYGAGVVLKALAAGELLDAHRLPILSLLALAGAVALLWKLYRDRGLATQEAFVLSGAVVWLLVFFGRPTWGRLLLAIGATGDLHLHRVVGALQIFLILLGAIAMESLWRQLARRGQIAGALAATVVILAPMLRERATYLAQNEAQLTGMRMAYQSEAGVLEGCIASVMQAGGRVYAGGAMDWGSRFQIANIPFFAFLNLNLVPQISAAYSTVSLTADLVPEFQERNRAHYRLFNVRNVIAPAGLPAELPPFVTRRVGIGHNVVYDAPGGGYFDVVDARAAVATNRTSFREVNRRWLESDWVEKRAHLWLDWDGRAPASLPRLAAADGLPPAPAGTAPGEVVSERQAGEAYAAEFSVTRPAFVLFKMTWHPRWVAYVEGKAQPTAMLSPGFVGVPVSPGRHHVLMRYEPGNWKPAMALGGMLLVLWAAAAERRGYLSWLGLAPGVARGGVDGPPAAPAGARGAGAKPERRRR